MTKKELMEIIDKVTSNYLYLNRQKDGEKERLIKSYITELKDYKAEDVIQAIDEISKTSRFAPSVAEIKVMLNPDTSNINWDSCYWYENLREFCDRDGTPYYDIHTGKSLQPFN